MLSLLCVGLSANIAEQTLIVGPSRDVTNSFADVLFFGASGGEAKVMVNTHIYSDWQVEFSADWLSLSVQPPDGIDQEMQLLFTVDFNPSTSTRLVMVKVAGQTIWMKQAGQQLSLDYVGPGDFVLESLANGVRYVAEPASSVIQQFDVSSGFWLNTLARDPSPGSGIQVVYVTQPFRHIDSAQSVFALWSDSFYYSTDLQAEEQLFAFEIVQDSPFSVASSVIDSGYGHVLVGLTSGQIRLIDARSGFFSLDLVRSASATWFAWIGSWILLATCFLQNAGRASGLGRPSFHFWR
ncbi:MAG: hypothetical protein LR015_08780 [Verrucomicrobia bacterium]|nr:hypothetical protein [Verrucomicrobiota bacterium]